MPETMMIGTREACRLLDDIDKNTLHRWIRAGLLPEGSWQQLPGRFGAYIFDEAQLAKFAEDLRSLAEAAPPVDALPGMEAGR